MLKIFAKSRAKRDVGTPKLSNHSLSISSLTDSESSLDTSILQQTVTEEKDSPTTAPVTNEIGEDGDQNIDEKSPPPPIEIEPIAEPTPTEASIEQTTATSPPTTEAETSAPTRAPVTVTPSTTERSDDRYVRRDRTSTTRTTPEPEDSYEYREKKEREEAMMRVWKRSMIPKKLPFPSRYPGYLREPPELSFEDTSLSVKRRIYTDARIKLLWEKPFKRDESRVIPISPKMNRTVELRRRYIRREPLVSSYFAQHYNQHKRPPFRNNNVKFCN